MKAIKYCLALFLLLGCWRAWTQTNSPAVMPVEHDVDISADSFYFDGNTNQLVYLGHVFVDDKPQARLNCERLTVYLPEDRGHPTNIVAEINVVVDVLDNNGQTNHITADKGVYSYQLLNPVTNIVKNVPLVTYAATNEVITFTGGDPMPKLVTPKGYVLADPLIIDVVKKRFETPGHVEMHFKELPGSGGSTNGFKL
jgi:hypothetical protein